ncbi:MAG TPA: TssN family type VI secretion system protein [Bacteroidia bacterium]|nr:TssN family type VI secretion system protein [Bacteroidia bacterium]
MLDSILQSKAGEGKAKALSGAKKVSTLIRVKYAIVFILLLSIPFAFGFLKIDTLPYFYICMQAYALLIGIIHLWQMGKRFDWRNVDSFYQKMNLSLTILILAIITGGVVVYFCPPINVYWMIFPSSLLFFLFPLLAISTFDFAIRIPDPLYKKWRYPENMILPDPDTIDFSNSHIVTFELKKNARDTGNTFMKFKAPQDRLTFGDLFYLYMTEYNEKNRESQIQYMNDSQHPYEWLFYIKPQKWWQSKIYIDPSLTVRENKIRENFIIISKRVSI